MGADSVSFFFFILTKQLDYYWFNYIEPIELVIPGVLRYKLTNGSVTGIYTLSVATACYCQ